ncbi:hypothetical protein ACIA8F_03560 [Streptomyces sp. NPDC051563]|uniref:hypothetical protein n=1 Tax=Streptomyces sp. NPDC051563 TaxID=3365659 RepID=UPI0037BAFC47
MRTALRTSIVTAALAGALLAPAATALATPARAAAPVTAVAAAVSADPSGNDRYDGEIVDLGKGRIAVLRNKSEGPEVWIRAVSPDWKPGDGWAGRVLAKLDLTHPLAVLDGVRYRLTDHGEGFDVRVLGEGASTFRQMPEAERAAKPAAGPAAKSSAKPAARPAEQAAAQPAVVARPQTAVVPQGPVAAGADLDAPGAAAGTAQAAATDTDDTITAAAGAGLLAILAGLGTTFAVRARKARTHG